MTRCLYIVYWGATEPLGQTLVLPPVLRLAEAGEEVFLVTFDKAGDTADSEILQSITERLNNAGVHWQNLRYHKRPRNWSTLYDVVRGVAFCWWWSVRYRIKLVHARTYVGGIIGWLLSYVRPIRYVFHNDGFWPDEQVDNRIWRLGSKSHRLARWIESRMYRRADAVVVLSRRARDVIPERARVSKLNVPVTIIPSSVDMSRFENGRHQPNAPFRLIYVGSLGGRYLINELLLFMDITRREIPGAECRIVTRTEPKLLIERAQELSIDPTGITMGSADPEDIPGILAEQSAAVFLLRDGLSNRATSATKVGEYLAAGLPVATSTLCGDVDLIVEETNTGVVVKSMDSDSFAHAVRALHALTNDPGVRDRCRAAADRYYSLDRSMHDLLALHEAVLSA